jgi:2-C-methyl-D-erythritol 4-phosphate cytidylyltransferase
VGAHAALARAVLVTDGRVDLQPLGDVPALVRSVRGLLSAGIVGAIAVRVPRDRREPVERVLAALPVTVHDDDLDLVEALRAVEAHTAQRPGPPPGDARIVTDPAGPGVGTVLLHDAARALAPPATAVTVAEAVGAGHAIAVPVLPLSDTVKRLDPTGRLDGTPDRAALRVVQTPQAFRADLFEWVLTSGALDRGPVEQAYAAADAPVRTVPGDPLAFPVRSAFDRELAELWCAETRTVAGPL